ncbi:MAG: ATP-dependent zinc protease [Deltaproteobacteria bacterium]|nr:ATP-dependent zinc protease [Deltaproteobacteria bacterium]
MPKGPKIIIGWWEYLHLPALHKRSIKAKIDTGARTSALHAEDSEVFKHRGISKVRFTIYPNQKDRLNRKQVIADLIDQRTIKSSMGHTSFRPVIETPVCIGGLTFDAELTLVNRDLLGFRMLLGRQALKQHFLIDPKKKNILSRKK